MYNKLKLHLLLTRAQSYKTFTGVVYACNKLECLSLAGLFQASLMFEGKVKSLI